MRNAAFGVLAVAAFSGSVAWAQPTSGLGVYVEPDQVQNPLLACYTAQLRHLRRMSIRTSGPRTLLTKTLTCGLKWLAFEPNTAQTEALARNRIDAFLHKMWTDGRFQGQKPSEAYFVKCGAGVTTQAERDRGFLACEVGFAPLKPAEFEIFRIVEKTAAAD